MPDVTTVLGAAAGRRERAARLVLTLLAIPIMMMIACGGGAQDAPEAPPEPEPSPSPTTTAGPTPSQAPPTPPAEVRAGELDPDFGDGGLAIVPVGSELAVARRGLFVFPDGRTSVLALASDDGGFSFTLLYVRLPADGRGPASVARPLPTLHAVAAVFAPDGSATVLGKQDDEGGIVAARLTPGGELDPSFGTGGFAATGLELASDVLPLPDGSSVVLGLRALLRLTDDGEVDRGFGRDGLASLPPPESDEGGYTLDDLGVTSDGRLIAAARYQVALATFPRLFGFTAGGEVDTSFGDAGVVAPSILRPGSRLLVGGDGVLRWLIDGEILLLGARGQTLGSVLVGSTTYGAGFVHLWQPEEGGGVLLAGSSWVPDEPRRFACWARTGDTCLRLAVAVQSIDANGALDTAFGDGGTATTDLPPPYGAQDTVARAGVAGPAGRLTVAGSACRRPFECDVAVLRYGAP